MSYKLTKIEKETIIIFNEAEQTATITTYNSALIKKLDLLCVSRSVETKLIGTDSMGGKEYTVPKKWIKVQANRILSEDEQEKLTIRAEKMRATRYAKI